MENQLINKIAIKLHESQDAILEIKYLLNKLQKTHDLDYIYEDIIKTIKEEA